MIEWFGLEGSIQNNIFSSAASGLPDTKLYAELGLCSTIN